MRVAREYIFPKLFLRCFGEEEHLNKIDLLFNYSDTLGSRVDIQQILKIITDNQILSYTEGRTIPGKIDSIKFNSIFKRYNLLIDEDEFSEYIFYTNPSEMAKFLGFSKEEELSILYDIKRKKNLP